MAETVIGVEDDDGCCVEVDLGSTRRTRLDVPTLLTANVWVLEHKTASSSMLPLNVSLQRCDRRQRA